jgi:hypothetical protein
MPHANEDELLAAINSYAGQSLGSGASDNGALSKQRTLSLDAYAGKQLVSAPKGRSSVNDRAVFETIQWIMPSMMRIFAGGDNVVEFDPTGPEDEEVAEQESDYLNYQVTQKSNWELTVRTWCQDALNTKNAYCLVDMEEKLTPEKETYEGQTEEQLVLLLEDGMEVVEHKQFDDPDDEGVLLDPINQEPIDPQDQATMLGASAIYEATGQEPQRQFKQLFDVVVKRVEATSRLKFTVLPPERTRVAQDTPDFTLEECNYFEYWDLMTISDLRRCGFDVPDDISDQGAEDTEEGAARDDPLQEDDEVESQGAMRQVTVRTVWIKFDYDDDGIAELQKVVIVGSEILDREETTRIPVACIVPYINTHRHIGNSITDLVIDIQNIKTKMLRGGLDSIELALNPGHVASDQVKIPDLMVSRPGRIVRLKKGARVAEGHVMPLPTENTFPFAMQGLQHMDTVVESRVGVNRMFQGIDSSNMNDHDRVGQLSTMASQRIEDIARLFGTGFKRLFSIAHELIIKSGHQDETMKLRGKWVDIDPTQWRTGRDMRVVAPFAAGNKDSLLQRLMLIGNIHEKALAAGAPFVQMDDAYELSKMIAGAADIPASKVFTDPATVEPPPPAPDHTETALQIENKKVDNEAADEARGSELDKYKTDSDAAVKKYQTDVNAQTQIALAQIKEGQQINLETIKADLKNAPVELANSTIATTGDAVNRLTESVTESIAALNAAVQKIQEDADSPVEIVRENGKIVGKKRGDKFIPISEAK